MKNEKIAKGRIIGLAGPCSSCMSSGRPRNIIKIHNRTRPSEANDASFIFSLSSSLLLLVPPSSSFLFFPHPAVSRSFRIRKSPFLDSGPVGDDDLWHHHVGGFSPFSFSFPSVRPSVPPPGQLALRPSQLALRPSQLALRLSLCGNTIGHRPLRGRCPLTTKLTE